ncbi:apolipoprotein N-acyltransferase [Pseudoroseicyclus tamaricis]|uniref:Apolipoprotein N-acyltransferase n=1 Tax=Pseudoroseicyclus tamaricis TaxID=2705421 RepID=A0A6B2JV85_9RHOB|nr:apolipoprotein N-acyltransferase [Pseudoroseicyclus tamaricis]NDV01805.1 apolipoprotein N-acyltransferase [Pseudoroseicyclus tamaricis]
MRRATAPGLPILLGALAALGQAPWGLWQLTVLALAGLFWLWPGRARPALFGLLAGFGYFAVALHWIVHPFLVEPEIYGWMAPFGLFFMALGGGVFWAIGAWGAAQLTRGGGVWAQRLALAGGLAAVELLRGLIFTGFPWALIGHVWVGTPLAQLAAWIGPHGLTTLSLLVAAGIAGLAAGRHRWMAALPVLALAPLWPLLATGAAPASEGPMIRIVQPNAPQAEKWRRPEVFYQRLLDLSAGDGAGAPPDLVVWPETAVPWWLNSVGDRLPEMAESARGAPLVTGILRQEGARLYNSLITLGPAGEVQSLYDKAHLVPFGEYMPWGDVLGRFGLHGLAASEGSGFSSGPGARVIEVPRLGPMLPLICYEGIFAEEVRAGAAGERPRAMLLITNDAWFGPGAGPKQHLAQARLRAIEQGLPMIRAANTGISAMIDAKGRVTAELPLGVAGALDARLPEALAPTLYARLGDGPAAGAMLLLLLGAALGGRRFRG